MNLFLGVDPGLGGAIALVDANGRLIAVEDMPISERGKGRVKHEVDAAGLAHLLRPHAQAIGHCIVESVGARPGQGVASMFSLGHSLGVATAVLACLGIGHELLPATKWKRLAEVPSDKALVLTAARRLWPDAPRSPGSRTTGARRRSTSRACHCSAHLGNGSIAYMRLRLRTRGAPVKAFHLRRTKSGRRQDVPLRPAHELFVAHFLVDFHATRAYMAVYPAASYNSARTEASKLLADPRISKQNDLACNEIRKYLERWVPGGEWHRAGRRP